MLSELKAFKETFKIKRPKVSYIMGFVFTLYSGIFYGTRTRPTFLFVVYFYTVVYLIS